MRGWSEKLKFFGIRGILKMRECSVRCLHKGGNVCANVLPMSDVVS